MVALEPGELSITFEYGAEATWPGNRKKEKRVEWELGGGAREGGEMRCTINLTYPGYYSPVETGQLSIVIGNLFFDDPGEQADRNS